MQCAWKRAFGQYKNDGHKAMEKCNGCYALDVGYLSEYGSVFGGFSCLLGIDIKCVELDLIYDKKGIGFTIFTMDMNVDELTFIQLGSCSGVKDKEEFLKSAGYYG